LKKSKFLHQRVRTSAPEERPPTLSEKCPHWKTLPPPWVRTSFMVRP